jgi:hypothetical protein
VLSAAACVADVSATTTRRVVRRATPAADTGVRGAPTTAWASCSSVKRAGESGAMPARYNIGSAIVTASALQFRILLM